MVESLELGEVPFYWRVKKAVIQTPYDIPTRLPFAFAFMEDLQLVIQRRNPEVLKWLGRVYKEDANVGYLQEGHALADSYGGEFIEFFWRASALLPKSPASAADIGCGGVYLLQKVMEQGLTVKGIDPSPVTATAGRKAGIEIVPDFYPSPLFKGRFDVLFHYDVLEHVEDPVAFLRAHHGNLSSHGALIFAVPNCSHHIALGDVSMLLHEHLNYFDEDSLARVVRAAGFEPMLLEPACHGGVLLCCAVPMANRTALAMPVKDDSKFQTFRAKAQAALQRFASLARQSGQGELGLYVPLRAFPYLTQLAPETRVRFFDDDPGLRGRYYDGFDVAIENRDELASRHPAQVIICSLAFGHKIAARLREKQLDKLRIVMWSELFDEEEV
jgi:2-polyprenyl-3-methyl-5-hydroxy-6-metoxy-1,4-benzoquinol methylase